MRLIDADALWSAMQKIYTDGDCGDEDRYKLGVNVGITKCYNLISNAPSVDLVHCDECRHADKFGHCKYVYWDNGITSCSKGER